MLVDRDDPYAVLWLSESYERGLTGVVKQLVGLGSGCVDVGAHHGYYSLLASRLVGPTGRVFAFEPEPFNFARLSENVALNGATNVTPVALAAARYLSSPVRHGMSFSSVQASPSAG